MVLGVVGQPAGAATGSGSSGPVAPSTVDRAGQFGLTVSWLPTTTPVTAIPGKTTHGTFWVTNETPNSVPVTILPATAVPGDNGSLGVKAGADPRFPSITYSPRAFIAPTQTTTAVTVTVTTPPSLSPGVYLIPAVVRPTAPKKKGNIQIQQEIDALVTFQVPGATKASVQPTFVGSSSFHIPGLPPIQIATSGSQTLRVLDDSPASFYAYTETTATQSPFGQVVFQGHTAGDPSDLRTAPSLYFPHRYRDYPTVWHPSSLGIGLAHLHAYVSYHPNPGVIVQKQASAEVLVVSPWWILVLAAYLALLLLWAVRRTRRQASAEGEAKRQRTAAGRVSQVLGSAVTALVIVAAAFLSRPVVFGVIAAAGVVIAAAGAAASRRRGRSTTARRALGYQALIGLLLLFGVVAVVLASLSTWSAAVAIGVLAGAGVWVVLAWWLLWWNEERSIVPGARPEGTDPPSPAQEPVPVGA